MCVTLKYRFLHMFIESPQSLLLSSWELVLSESCSVLVELLQRGGPVFLLVAF